MNEKVESAEKRLDACMDSNQFDECARQLYQEKLEGKYTEEELVAIRKIITEARRAIKAHEHIPSPPYPNEWDWETEEKNDSTDRVKA